MPYGDYVLMKRWTIAACFWYYVMADPIMDDRRYDALVDSLKLHEKMRVPDNDSPTQMIWGDRTEQYPEWAKTKDGWQEII